MLSSRLCSKILCSVWGFVHLSSVLIKSFWRPLVFVFRVRTTSWRSWSLRHEFDTFSVYYPNLTAPARTRNFSPVSFYLLFFSMPPRCSRNSLRLNWISNKNDRLTFEITYYVVDYRFHLFLNSHVSRVLFPIKDLCLADLTKRYFCPFTFPKY